MSSNGQGNNIIFYNNGAFSCSFSIQWNGGGSGRTGTVLANQSTRLDLTRYTLADATSCWARVYVYCGITPDSGRHLKFLPGGANTGRYNHTRRPPHPPLSHNR